MFFTYCTELCLHNINVQLLFYRLRVDDYEYVSMKVIVLLTADTSDIREKETVRESQEKVSYQNRCNLLYNKIDG